MMRINGTTIHSLQLHCCPYGFLYDFSTTIVLPSDPIDPWWLHYPMILQEDISTNGT
jgi:hypothetical protein